MERTEIRLRILELALEHGVEPNKVEVAHDYAEFVFDYEPARLRVAATVTKIGRLK